MSVNSSKRETLARIANTLVAGALLGAGVSACGSDSASDAATGQGAATTAATSSASSAASSFLTYKDPYHALVDAAGYTEKTATVNGVTFSYREGPGNGPALVLLHAQMLDWFSYSRVLPDLAKSYHVYDIDYQGHGATTTPADYPMTANQIGADLGDFIEKIIGQPVYVTGNSSGGLLAAWLAAYRPALVTAALLEDPPLFSSEYPAIETTIADRAFATSYTANVDHPTDFLLYYIDKNSDFFTNNVGPGAAAELTAAIIAYRLANPGQPVELSVVQDDTIRMMLRGLDYQYDPRFGAAFYDGTWNAGFDHATALSLIACPVLLMQANTSTLADGTLDGAMTVEQAATAVSLLKNGTYLKVDADHVVNLVDPTDYLNALDGLFVTG